jgi:hypothetical protein
MQRGFSAVVRGIRPARKISLLNLEDRRSYRIDYSEILEGARNGRKCLILLVGAGRFERPTPCAQGGGRHHAETASFQDLLLQADGHSLL